MDIGKVVKEEPKGEWFTIYGYEGKENPPQLKMLLPKPSRQKELRQKATCFKFNGKDNVRELDMDKLEVLIRDEVITDWKNIEMNGEPLECNSDNRKLLDDNWREYNSFWNAFFTTGKSIENDVMETDQKN